MENLREILIDFVAKKYEEIYWLKEGGFESRKDEIPDLVDEYLKELEESKN